MSTLASQASPGQSVGPSQVGPGPGQVGPGQTTPGEAPPAPRASAPGWSKPKAYRGDSVLLGAKLFGFTPNVRVSFKIFASTSDPSKALASLTDSSDASGIASSQWTVKYDPARQDDPRLLFEASSGGASSTSPILLVCDFADATLTGEDGSPLASVPVTVTDAAGNTYPATTDAKGHFHVDPIGIGKYSVAVKDFLVQGEKSAGEKKFDSGAAQSIALKKMVYTIELTSPKDGDVFLAGDKAELKATVKRDGKDEGAQATFTTSGSPSASVTPGQPAGKGGEGTPAALNVGTDEGTVQVIAEYQGTKASVAVKVVRSLVSRFEIVDNGGNLFPLYSFVKQDCTPPFWEIGQDGKPHHHGAAVKFGTALKAKASLRPRQKTSKAATFGVVISTPAEIDVNPPGPAVTGIAPQRIHFEIPADKRAQGVTWGDGDTVVDLVANIPLPFRVRAYKWVLEARIVPVGYSPTASGAAPIDGFPVIDRLDGVNVFAIWGKPAIGEGKISDPGTEPLGKSQFDFFHLNRATRWADGGYNLLADDAGSIPRLIQKSMKHYSWPDEYEMKDGKHKAEHPRPANVNDLAGDGLALVAADGNDPTAAGSEPTGQNWGFGVLDNPTTPGGKPHQIASAMAAALNLLGVKASVQYLRRAGGAVNLREHDPVTIGAQCFDPARDWGATLVAFVVVPVDTSRDGDAGKGGGGALHAQEPLVFDPPVRGGPRRSTTSSDAKTTGHVRKVTIRDKLLAEECRCGHPLRRPAQATPPSSQTIQIQNRQGTFNLQGGGNVTISGQGIVQGGVQVNIFIDNAFKGQVGTGNTIMFSLPPGNHAGSWQVQGEGRRWNGGYGSDWQNVSGNLTISVRPIDDNSVVVTVPTNQRNQQTRYSDPAQNPAQATITTDGALSAQFSFAPNHTVRLQMVFQVDGGPVVQTGLIDPGGTTAVVNLGPVSPGQHVVKCWPQNISWVWQYWQGTLTVMGSKTQPIPKSCPTCGAQPKWRYACVSCKQLLDGAKPTGTHSCGQKLDALVESVLYPCPNCKKTVQDEDQDCWNCGTALQSLQAQKGWK